MSWSRHDVALTGKTVAQLRCVCTAVPMLVLHSLVKFASVDHNCSKMASCESQ